MKKRNLLLGILASMICIAWSGCSKDITSAPEGGDGGNGGNKPETEDLSGLIHLKSLDDYTPENHLYMFTPDEPESVMFSDARRFDPRHPVQVSVTDDQKLLLRAFSPRKISNMDIWARIDGYDERFLLARFDIIPPFLEFSQLIPFVVADKEYRTEQGHTIRIMANPHLNPDNLSLEIACEDPYYKKFAQIKTTWTVGMTNWNNGSGYYDYPVKAGHCREAVAMSINAAYMFSSPEYEAKMREYNGKFYGNGSGGNGPVIPDNGILIEGASNGTYGARTRPNFSWGHVNGVGGMGATWYLGLTDDSFVSHYADDNGGSMAWFHEFGHGMGYGDSNNTVISNDGDANTPSWRKVCQELYRQMCIDKKLPIYSRRFMHSRRNYDFYSPEHDANWRYAPSAVIIEDPELDELDGGLAASDGFMPTDKAGDKGQAVSFRIDYTTAGVDRKNYAPREGYAYGDMLYVINDIRAADASLDVYDISSGQPALKKRISQWTHPVSGETIAVGILRSVVRSYDKLYIAKADGAVHVLDASSYECLAILTPAGGVSAMAVADGALFTFHQLVRAYPEHLVSKENALRVPSIAATSAIDGNSNNAMTTDAEGNVYALSYHLKKLVRLDTDYLMAGKISLAGETVFEQNPIGAAFTPDGRLFVTFAAGASRLCEVDPDTGKVLRDFTSTGGITLRNPGKCTIRRNTLFVTDRNPEWCLYAIPLSELE